MDPIILASGSLQRQEYFKLLSLPYSIMPARIEEIYEDDVSPHKMAEDMAVKKVNRILELLKGKTPPWICGADTIIAVDGKIFGKPKDREDALRMLTKIHGRSHEVITAVALFNGKDRTMDCRSVISTVSFARLNDDEIEWYLNTGEWQGVAGGYKVQGLASCYITGIKGSYSSIVGLPIREFYVMLRENGYPYGEH
jgi:septum formation protein